MLCARKKFVLAVICLALVAGGAALPGQASAENRLPVAPAIYRQSSGSARTVTVQPVQWSRWDWRFNGPAYYGSSWSYGYGLYRAPVFYGPYAGGPVGVFPPVYYPPYPGAYWAYGYPQYTWGAFYGW
jgi:hypothetical protein